MSRRLVITDSSGLEIWKDIEGYEGLYQVSTLGDVKSLNYKRTGRERVLKVGNSGDGYLLINLSKDGVIEPTTIHRLVAKTFLPSPTIDQTDVNHKSEIKTDNSVSNLEWTTHKFNMNWGSRIERSSRARSKPVIRIDVNGDKLEYSSAKEAERHTGINYSNIIACCKGKLLTAGGYIWRYME